MRFGVICFRLLQSRERRCLIPFGGRHTCLGVQNFGLTCRDARLRRALRDGDIRILRAQFRLCLEELRLHLFEGNLIVARIHFRNELARLDGLILFHVDGLDHTIDPRRDPVEVPVYLSIIG